MPVTSLRRTIFLFVEKCLSIYGAEYCALSLLLIHMFAKIEELKLALQVHELLQQVKNIEKIKSKVFL